MRLNPMFKCHYTCILLFALCYIIGSLKAFDILERKRQPGWISGPTLSRKIDTFMNNVIGYQYLQDILDREKFTPNPLDREFLVSEFTETLSTRLDGYIKSVEGMRDALQEVYQTGSPTVGSIQDYPQCCAVEDTQLDNRYNNNVDTGKVCYRVQLYQNQNSKVPATQEYYNALRRNINRYPHLKWQYYGTRDGVTVNYPANKVDDCHSYDPRIRPWYVQTATSVDKDIVILIDLAVSTDTMDISRKAALTALVTMNPNDRVAVVAFNHRAYPPVGTLYTDTCFSEHLSIASTESKSVMQGFIESLNAGGSSEYLVGLEKAFSYFDSASYAANRERMILLISDGHLLDTRDTIFNRVKELNRAANNTVVIHTFAVGPDVTEDSADLLETLSKQDWGDEEIEDGVHSPSVTSDNLRYEMASYYDLYSVEVNNSHVITVPYLDGWGLGMVLSVCTRVHYPEDTLAGVACVDIVLADILSQVEYYNFGESSYVFIIDGRGRAMYHPRLPFVYTVTEDPVVLDIKSLENHPQMEDVIDSMMRQETGERTIDSVLRVTPRGSSSISGYNRELTSAVYNWAPIESTDFSLCVVTFSDDVKTDINLNVDQSANFLYHRLDLQMNSTYLTPGMLCADGDLASTTDSSAVHFGARCFYDPYDFLTKRDTRDSVQEYRNYMKGRNTAEGADTFRPNVREMVALTGRMDDFWKIDTEDSHLLLLRYLGSSSGFTRRYPARSVTRYYDPLLRIWYKTAVAFTGKITLTPPYPDISPSIGTVYTMSRTIYLGKTNQQHDPTDPVVAVLSGDFRAAFIYRLLKEFSVCQEENVRCFLVDTAGFLVYHESFLGTDDVENVHIAKQEPAVADYLIKNGHMRNQLCLDMKTLQERYSWEIELTDNRNFIDNLDSTPSFEMQVVSNTNVFLVAKVSSSDNDDNEYADCDCNQDGGDLSRCTSAGTDHCECPCYTRLNYNYCEAKLTEENSDSISCFPDSTPPKLRNEVTTEQVLASDWNINVDRLPACYSYSCDFAIIESECTHDGCSWCADKCVDSAECDGPEGESQKMLIIIIAAAAGVVVIITVTVIVFKVLHGRKNKQKRSVENSKKDPDYMSVDSMPGEVGNQVALGAISINQPVEDAEQLARHINPHGGLNHHHNINPPGGVNHHPNINPPRGLNHHHNIIHARNQYVEEEDNYDNNNVNVNAHGAYNNQGFDPPAAEPVVDLHDVNAYTHGNHQANEQPLQNVPDTRPSSEPVYLKASAQQGAVAGPSRQQLQ